MQSLTITPALLKELFDECNNEFFDNSLPSVLLKVSNAGKALGRCMVRGERITISVSRYYQVERDEIKSVMIHEMIHLWEWITFRKMGHTQNFKGKAREIEIKSEGKFSIKRLAHRDLHELANPEKYKNRLYAILKEKDPKGKALPYIWVVACSENAVLTCKEPLKRMKRFDLAGFVRNRYEKEFDRLPRIKSFWRITGKRMTEEVLFKQYSEFAESIEK